MKPPPPPRLNEISVRLLRAVADNTLPLVMNLREQAELAALAAMKLVARAGGAFHLTDLGRRQLENERDLT